MFIIYTILLDQLASATKLNILMMGGWFIYIILNTYLKELNL